MKHLFYQVVLVACLSTAGLSSVRAGDPLAGPNGAPAIPQASPSIRIEVLVRNLWDVLWQNPPVRERTGRTRFGWKWLATHYDKDGNGVVTREEFPGKADDFTRLDRNWDGKLTAEDFDWTDKGVLARQKATTFALFKAIDRSSDGRITAEEWQAAFKKIARDKKYLDDRDLEELIFLPHVRKMESEQSYFTRQSQAGINRLLRMLENGSLFTDGPEPGELAPDFVLHTPDGKTRIRLSSYRGKKPVVLIFGSFT